MKRLFFLFTIFIIIIVFSGCVKTEDLEKRRAEELAQLEEANSETADSNQETDNTDQNSDASDSTDVNENTTVVTDNESTVETTDSTNEENTVEDVEAVDIKKLKAQIDADNNKIAELEKQLEVAQSSSLSGPILGNSLLSEATNIMSALSTNDMATLSLYIPSINGVRVSPYQFVDLANDVVLSQNDVLNLFTITTNYTWGSYDGSGDPITMTPSTYYNEFIYDYNYLIAPQIGQNTILSSGNLINNISTVYPTASFVEFYFPGFDPQYGGMDWSSLTLVMENQGGYWKLIGIVHGQWTI